MTNINIVMDYEAIAYLKELENKAKSETLEVKGYIAGARWEWSDNYCLNLERAAILVHNERTADAVVMKYDKKIYSISKIQIDLHSGKIRTSLYKSNSDFYKAISEFGFEFYSMVKSYSSEIKNK